MLQARRVHPQPSAVLVGLESVGKSAVFRLLTGAVVPDEANFRGSTIMCRRGAIKAGGVELTDTPGMRFEDDSVATRMALTALGDADTVVLVVRATHAKRELATMFEHVGDRLVGRRLSIVLTFGDLASRGLASFSKSLGAALGVPVEVIDARSGTREDAARIERAVANACPLAAVPEVQALPTLGEVVVPRTPLERRAVGAPLAAVLTLMLYGVPVYLAYALSAWAQPLVDASVVEPVKAMLTGRLGAASLAAAVLVGPYGVLTLGWYSFLWAFPVVFLLGASVAVTDESGLRDRITAALDPWLRRVGLDGRDLNPVLTGYGCNVVAVLQTRSSSVCTRKACVSLVAFGSACSYQMGAALSLFGASDRSWLFVPYLLVLFVVGALHARLWNPSAVRPRLRLPLAERSFLQWPRPRSVLWKLAAACRQFLLSAMPIFVAICLAAAVLAHLGVIARAASVLEPVLGLFRLPAEAAPGVVFSLLRKDGLLVLNENDGALVRALTGGQIFVLVYLASTLAACLVTLWTVRRDLGLGFALRLAGRQALTASVSAITIAWLLALV